MRWISLIVVALLTAFFVANAAADTVTLRIGTVVAPTSPQAKAVDRFAEILNGRKVGIEVKVFHASQLGAAQVQVQNIKLGIQEGIVEALDWYSEFSADLRVITAPFTFVNRDHYERWLRSDAFAKAQEGVIKNGNQRVLIGDALWRRGPFRVMMATRPVLTLDDVSKIKLRLWDNETILRFWGRKGLGANTVNIPFGDVYVALRQGAVDAVTTPFDLVVSQKFAEVAPHIMLFDEFWQIVTLSINEKRWQSLSDTQRKALTSALDEGGKFYNQQVAESLEGWKKQLVAGGAKLYEIERGPFVERVRQLNQQWQAEGYWRPGFLEDIAKLR